MTDQRSVSNQADDSIEFPTLQSDGVLGSRWPEILDSSGIFFSHWAEDLLAVDEFNDKHIDNNREYNLRAVEGRRFAESSRTVDNLVKEATTNKRNEIIEGAKFAQPLAEAGPLLAKSVTTDHLRNLKRQDIHRLVIMHKKIIGPAGGSGLFVVDLWAEHVWLHVCWCAPGDILGAESAYLFDSR